MPVQSGARRLIYGLDTTKSLKEVLKDAGSTKPMLVSTAHYSSTSFYRKVKEELDAPHVEFREVTYGPPLPEIEHLAEMYRNKECDSMVSIGDSNVIWASKLLKYYFAHDASHVAIPTTLTASSFSDWAEYRLGDEVHHVSDASTVPDTVILDPMASMETEVAAWHSSGLGIMDYAFSNLLREGISSETEDLLTSSLEGLVVNLPGRSVESRMECFLSSWYSKEDGYRVDHDPMTEVRNAIKSRTDLPEDLISATVLPLTVYRCREINPNGLATLATRLGFRGSDVLELSDKVLEMVQGLERKLGIGESLAEMGYSYNDLKKIMEETPFDFETVDRVLSPVLSPL